MAQAHGGAEWAELVFHHLPGTSEGQKGARASRRICSRTQDNSTGSEIHQRIRVLQCAHARSETVHNAHHYNLLSPWHRHIEVPNGRSSYSAVLSAVLRGKNTQAHNIITSITVHGLHREAHPVPQQSWYCPGPGASTK